MRALTLNVIIIIIFVVVFVISSGVQQLFTSHFDNGTVIR